MDAPDFLNSQEADHFRQIEHVQSPCWGESHLPREVALAYLRLPSIIAALGLDVPVEPADLPAWGPEAAAPHLWRWLPDREIERTDRSDGDPGRHETIVLTLQQRVRAGRGAIDVSGSGIAITLHKFDRGLAVAGAASTARPHSRLDATNFKFEEVQGVAQEKALELISELLTAVAAEVFVQDLRAVALRPSEGRPGPGDIGNRDL